MLFSHTVCAVESYYVATDRPGAFGDEIVVDGWFLTHAPIRAMQLRFAGGAAIDIHDRQRPSDELLPDYGAIFGESARHRRFRLVEPLGIRELDLASAVFVVEHEDGTTVSRPLASIFVAPPPSTYTPEEQALVMGFDSVGDSCEFGLMQRHVGRERMSFLRYGGVGNVFALAEAIADGLTLFDHPGSVHMHAPVGEWITMVPGLDLSFHTGRSEHSIAWNRIAEEERQKLAFTAQLFIEDCQAGEKIFVYRVHRDERGGPDGTRGMDALHDALRRHGPARLLWVNVADEAHGHATVRHERDGLWRGWIDHLAPPWDAFDSRPRSWLALLAEARARMG
jgi:hypothetical protein